MISIPSFTVGNNIYPCNFPNDQPFSFPIIVNFPSLSCITPYGSCPNIATPMMMNLNNPNCTVPNNFFPSNQLISLDISQQMKNDLISKTTLNPNANQISAANESNKGKTTKSINLFNSSNSESTFDSSKKSARVHFTKKEDDRIKELVERFGKKNWSIIASFMNGRSAKQCRDRYCNYLVPGFFQGEWSKEEDDLLLKLYKENGSKWSIIQGYFPKRSSNSVKNRWYYFLRKKYEEEENRKKNEEEKNKETNEKNEKENVGEAQVELNFVEDESNEEEENIKTEFFAIPDEVQMQPKENDNIFEINRNVLDSLNENGWMLFD